MRFFIILFLLCGYLYGYPNYSPQLAQLSHTFSGSSNTLTPHLDRYGSEAVLIQHCPHYPNSQSQASERRFASIKCETSGLADSIKRLYEFEETKQLINLVESKGSITIKAANLGLHASNAAWYPDDRMICINFSKKRSLGSLICSLVFELHNASSQHHFDKIDKLAMQGEISKSKYIESVEYLEYTNALKTAQMLKNGVAKGIFPPDAFYSVAPNFSEHFMIQQEAGHSAFIGNIWQSLNKNRMI